MWQTCLTGLTGLTLVVLLLGATAQTAQVETQQNRWIPEELEDEIRVKVVFNREAIFFKLQFTSVEGIYHDYLRYEGGSWVTTRGSSPGIHPDRLYEDRVSFLLDDGSVRHFATQGGYITIHEEMRFLANQAPRADVQRVLGQDDVRKYLPETRRTADWRSLRRPEELEELRQSGVFLDLWQWRAHRSDPVGFADDNWVFEYRNADQGKSPFADNWHRDTQQPRFMYDIQKVGFQALTWEDVANHRLSKRDLYYLTPEIAVSFDPNHPWQEGDTLPRRLVQMPEGSRGDIRAHSQWQNGVWDVELRRALDPGHALDDKSLKPKRVYHIAFAVHKNSTGSRWHYTSFPYSLGLDTDADIVAQRFEGQAPPWEEMPWQTIPLFYPGQVTWTFLTSDAHAGKAGIEEGRPCASCHTVAEMGKYAVEHELKEQILPRWYLTVAGGMLFVLGIAVAGARLVQGQR